MPTLVTQCGGPFSHVYGSIWPRRRSRPAYGLRNRRSPAARSRSRSRARSAARRERRACLGAQAMTRTCSFWTVSPRLPDDLRRRCSARDHAGPISHNHKKRTRGALPASLLSFPPGRIAPGLLFSLRTYCPYCCCSGDIHRKRHPIRQPHPMRARALPPPHNDVCPLVGRLPPVAQPIARPELVTYAIDRSGARHDVATHSAYRCRWRSRQVPFRGRWRSRQRSPLGQSLATRPDIGTDPHRHHAPQAGRTQGHRGTSVADSPQRQQRQRNLRPETQINGTRSL